MAVDAYPMLRVYLHLHTLARQASFMSLHARFLACASYVLTLWLLQLDYGEFRRGLARCGAVINDQEFEILVKAVDNNMDGKIQYLEFAETMKVPDVDSSKLARKAPYASNPLSNKDAAKAQSECV